MKGDYPDDTFTENDVLLALERTGKKYRNGSRYILAQCPLHDDEHPSVQIYKDDWFTNCHAGCGRFHITKAYPELRNPEATRNSNTKKFRSPSRRVASESPMTEHKYKEVDLMEFWESLPEIPQDHHFKGIPIDTLHDLGWRYDPNGDRYFIPYFSASRQSIPFAQWRNLADGPRFNFWKDAKPTCYGTWNLDNPKLFVVEGASDAAVLEYAAVPWIALPSAASKTLMQQMAQYCRENAIQLIYAGDNDAAGDKLREALDEIMPYRVKQVPPKYNDWGDFLEAEGVEKVQEYAFQELFPLDPTRYGDYVDMEKEQIFTLAADKDISRGKNLLNVKRVWPDAQPVELTGAPEKEISKELTSKGTPQPLF